jgi:hypothetical protein
MSVPLTESPVRQEFLAELESILESDEAYGSNIQILTYSVKDEVINGKFRDSWNNRVYEFVIDIDGISYKPAARLDSFSVNGLPAQLDSFSEGYTSLFANIRLDRSQIGKRVKKPKCGTEGYSCGFSCIGLTKTCRILSSGKKTRGEFQGKAIGKERLSKLIDLSIKLEASGDKKKFAAVNAVGARITSARNKYQGEGRDRLVQRQITNKEKQSTEPTLAPEKFLLSNKNFKFVGDKETREKLQQWIDIQQELEQAQLSLYDESIPDSRLIQRTTEERLDATISIVGAILKTKERKDIIFGGVVDKDGKLQAAYSYEITSDGYFVNLLASAPWNCLEAHLNKKKGAGASAIESLIKNAIAEKRKPRIELYPLSDAIPFYQKVGFTSGDMLGMELTEENAKKFIKNQEESAKGRKDASVNIESESLTELEILEENALGLFTVPADFELTRQKRR